MTQSQALSILKTGANVFLTGEPVLARLIPLTNMWHICAREVLSRQLQPLTGIAATHIGGMTVHSWSGIGIKAKLDKYDLDKISSRNI